MSGTPKKSSRLRTRRSPPPAPGLLLGLNREQMDSLLGVTELPGWTHYSAALEHLYDLNLGGLLRALPHDQYLFQCGVCYALEQIAKLPADLSEKVKAEDARQSARKSNGAAPGAALFANTPFWDAWQRTAGRAGGPGRA